MFTDMSACVYVTVHKITFVSRNESIDERHMPHSIDHSVYFVGVLFRIPLYKLLRDWCIFHNVLALGLYLHEY